MKYFLLFLTISIRSLGQNSYSNFELAFHSAKTAFRNQEFEKAKKLLTPFCVKNYHFPESPYAYYYCAMANYQLSNNYQARLLYKQLFEQYPNWEYLEQAKLNYAETNFQDRIYYEAMKSLDQILSPKYASLQEAMKQKYLSEIGDLNRLKELHQMFPTERIIAEIIVDKIQKNKYSLPNDLELSDRITNTFELKNKKHPPKKATENTPYKQTDSSATVRFAALLPFKIYQVNNEESSDNQYAYDLYAGMKMAAEQLKTEGIALQLSAFDVNNNEQDLLKIKNDLAINYTLVFGPLYPKPNKLASQLIVNQKIIQVHPISNNLSLIKDPNTMYLFQPSFTQQAKKAIEFIKKQDQIKSISLFYGKSKKDSTFAHVVAKEASKQGFRINKIQAFVNGTMNTEVGSVFYAGDPVEGSNFLNTIAQINPNVLIMASASSFNWRRIKNYTFPERFYLVYPEFIDNQKEVVQKFKKKYRDKMGIIPSYFVYAGYDMMLFYGRMLKEGKSLFKLNLNLGEYTDDFLLSGFDYSNKSNENSIVPIVKYNGERFEEIFR